MSVQFVDKVRFELNEIDSMFNSIGLNNTKTANSNSNCSSSNNNTNSQESTSNFTLSSSTKQTEKSNMLFTKLNEKKLKYSSTNSTTPKIPSNLVKSSSPVNHTLTSPNETRSDLMLLYDRKQLTEFLAERHDILIKTRNEYDLQFENFFSLAKKFNLEKLNNLKLTFKNQILKQQIYFETEMLDLCKEYNRDYECTFKTKSSSNTTTTTTTKSSSNSKRAQSKFDQEKNLVRQFKMDMKKLLDYMRESLINSSDTLIEAYETCQTLKSLENVETNFQKQNNQMKSTTNALIKSFEQNHLNNELDDEFKNDLDKQLDEEKLQFDKYKQEMDDLMHILDDIEVQHLQRKDQLTTKTKFCTKLKSKFKFIETKYETLNKQIANLKYENNVYKELWNEKKRTDLMNSLNTSCALFFKQKNTNTTINNNSNSNNSEIENSYSEFNSCSKSSAVSSLSPSSLSKSSSTSSLSDCVADLISSSNDTNSNTNESSHSSSLSSKSTTSSSSSSLCNQDLSDMFNGSTQLDCENESNDSDEHNKDDNKNYLSLADYNRKLSIINELINLHKSKMTSKDLWSMSSSNCTQTTATNTTTTTTTTNFIKANMKCFDHHDLDETTCTKLANYTNVEQEIDRISDDLLNSTSNSSIRLKQASSLDLTDCSTDGDRVIVENCNLKSDRDISNWYLTRQIENMSISKYKLPNGSVIKSGKVLKIETPFANDQLDYLIAIKNQLKLEQQHSITAKCQVKNKLCLKIRTKLLSPDGTLKAIHIQEIPQFYQDIFKYANMIQFL